MNHVNSTKEQFLLFRVFSFRDPKAFELLLADCGARVQRFLRMKLPGRQDAEDVYSEACLKMWNYATGTKIDAFAPVLHTIARTCVAEFYRRRSRRIEVVNNEVALESTGTEKLEQATVDQFDVERLKFLIEEMDEDDAQVIVMRYLDQLSIKEIAEQIGKEENTTKVMVYRAVQKLRKMVADKFGSL